MTITDPTQIHQQFADAVNRADSAALALLYEPSAVIVERDGSLTTGTDAIRRHLDELVDRKPVMRIVASRAFRNNGLALLSSHWRAEATTPDGATVELTFRGSELARKQPDGTWRLVLDNPWGADVTVPAAVAGAE